MDPLEAYLASKRAPDPRFVDNEPEPAPTPGRAFNNTGPDAAGQLAAAREAIKPSMLQSAVGGALQGATGGFSDEAGAALEHLLTGRPYTEARDENRRELAAEEKAHGGAYMGGQLVGGAALPGGSLAKTLATGAASGIGYSNATTPGGLATGAALGAGTGLLGYGAAKGAQKVIGKAAERVEKRALGSLREDVRGRVAERVGRETDRIKEVVKEPAMRKALGDPPKVLAAAKAGLDDAGTAADRILNGADKNAAAVAGQAGAGGMLPHEVVAPLEQLKNEMIQTSQRPAAVNAVQGVIDQFRGGLGRVPGQPVPATDVRRFLSQQIQAYAFKGDPTHVETLPTQQALQRASGVVKDALTDHVQKNASPLAAAALQKLWDRSTAYNAISAAAEKQIAGAGEKPNFVGKMFHAMTHHAPEGVGATVGGLVAGYPGAIGGAIVGNAAGKVGAAADRALATPGGALVGNALASGAARGASAPVIDALVDKRDSDAMAHLHEHVFGGGQ